MSDPKSTFDDAAFNNVTPFKLCLCGNLTKVSDKFTFSGIVNYRSFLCESCVDKYKTAARIICLRCKNLQGFVPPQQTREGFMFGEGKSYHIDGCLKCVPGKFSTTVLEYAAFLQKKGIPVKKDFDLIQEIEQKKLQVGRECAKLTAETIRFDI